MDKNSGGLLNPFKAYHFIKKLVDEAVGRLEISKNVPVAKVVGENNPADNQVNVSFHGDGTNQVKDMKPASMHFVSVPVTKEITPVFNYDDTDFYGPPLPIYDSLVNQSQLTPYESSEFKPNFSISPIQLTPGDVAVQGRYGHAIVFSDAKGIGKPTIRIGNSFRSRDVADVKKFESSQGEFGEQIEKESRRDSTMPIFFNPNIDGSSLYFLKNSSPGIDISIETELSGNQALVNYDKNVLSPTKGGMFQQKSPFVSERMVLASDSIFIYTKGANKIDRNISVLSSGQLTLNSMKNIFITTPDVDVDEGIGRIYIGNNSNPSRLTKGNMQPAVRGLEYLNTMVGLPGEFELAIGGNKISSTSVLGIIRSLAIAVGKLANGGISIDRNGTSFSEDFEKDILRNILDDLDNLSGQIIGKEIDIGDGNTIYTGDVSRKVYIE